MKSKITLVFLGLSLVSCVGQKSRATEEENMVGAETCLENPELSKIWGECNVKKTIYDARVKILNCTKDSKINRESMLQIKLRANGKVKEVQLEEQLENDKKLSQCLRREIIKLKFAAPPQGVKSVIMYPIDL